jgi:hypothetical protein
MIKFGRFEIDPQPSPLEPVYGLCLVANPGVGPILSGNADDIDRKKIQQVTGHGATGKSVLLEYIRLNPVGGQALLERVERSHSSGKAVFGFLKKVEEYVPLLRSTLEVYGMLPPRPDGWVDLYPNHEKVKERVLRITEAALGMAKTHKEKAEFHARRAQELKSSAKAAKRKMPDRVDHHFPLLNLVTSRAAEPGVISREQAVRFGEREEPRPSKRQRAETSQMHQPVNRAPPAETATSGAWEREEGMGIQRTVSFVTGQQTTNLELEQVGTRVPCHGSSSALAAQEADGWRPLGLTGALEFVSKMYVVGLEHARHFTHAALEVLGDQVHIEFISIKEWSDEAIQVTANNLSERECSDALVVFWLHDNEVFLHAASGAMLTPDSEGRYHCMGALGTITQTRMQRLWDHSWPLLMACKQAIGIVLITPIPMYITVPCCEDPLHCIGFGQTAHVRGICTALAGLRDATLRWVSRAESERILVFSPHLEILEAAQLTREDGMENLRDSFAYDGVHFSYTGNRGLCALMWNTIMERFRKLRPPSRNMPSPRHGPPLPMSGSRRHRRGRVSWWDDTPELTMEEPAYFAERTIVVEEREIRAVEAGPWANRRMQDDGPVIPADAWERMRVAAYEDRYQPSTHSRCHPA